ncbi:dCTP deaminase [Nocardia fluminea]|uniref:dCTP deaminase n=1 Tax=Nocardia fluminea TaxID=134984 RepID=A0A2N3V514_9NOCA|nr:deoxycytidine triphosphate deaminase [Nocardia fluminea]PKV76713.1 dCTP deaminase [Nocardia fluminea]
MLTGAEIQAARHRGELVIDPFDDHLVCANSIAFRLGTELLSYPAGVELDPHHDPQAVQAHIPPDGVVLVPDRLYLGSTAEAMGGLRYAATLHACRSVSSLGLRIQLSAPLGHCGAVIPWTLELRATVPVRVYAGMTIGKLAFWPMQGTAVRYLGRYRDSRGPVRSLIAACPPTSPVIPSAGSIPA